MKLASTVASAVLLLTAGFASAQCPVRFRPAVSYGGFGGYGEFLTVGDVNGDGRPDVVAGASDATRVDVFLGGADGLLHFSYTNRSFHIGSSAVLADFNGDGMLDLAGGDAAGGIAVAPGAGAGAFNFPSGFSPSPAIGSPSPRPTSTRTATRTSRSPSMTSTQSRCSAAAHAERL